MKTGKIARVMVLFLVAFALRLGASVLDAAEPTGDSPANGLSVACQVKTMPAASAVWYKIPYRKQVELALDLTAVAGVYFDVFAPNQVRYFPALGETVGRSVPQPDDPLFKHRWQGQLVQTDFVLDYYYVRVTNTISAEIMYQLCSTEIASAVVAPTGDSPAHGLTSASCALQSLDARTHIWHQVPYASGKELELYLKTMSTEMSFDVFTPDQVQAFPTLGQPIGRGTPNVNEPEYARSWQGHLPESGYYYVRVTNTEFAPVQYQLCRVEKEFPGSPATPQPTPHRRPRREF